MAGRLYVVAGPIGNLADLTPRAAEILASVNTVLAEDTRVSGRLLREVDSKAQLATLNEHTAPAKLDAFLGRLVAGEDLAILTDAGTPGISDPGALLVDLALENSVIVTPIPGASAVSTAISASGFFAQQYAFLGFLPRKPGPAKRALSMFAESTFTIVLFESPHRFNKTLAICAECLGARRYVIARELTKLHEQIYRNRLPLLPDEKEVPAKGEFTLVIEGLRKPEEVE